MTRWTSGLVATAGAMGAAGVVLGAAAAHVGGGDLARTGSNYLLLHAAAVLGIVAGSGRSRLLLFAASALAIGAIVFSGDLALLGLADARPFPLAAPIGGVGLIAGWVLVIVGAFRGERPA